jgi:hypothetical protein
LDDLEGNGMIERREDTVGRRTVAFYRPTQKRIAFCRDILEPYEKIFPRRKNENKRPTFHTGKRLSGFGSTHACVRPSVLTILSRLRQCWAMLLFGIYIHIIRTRDGEQDQKGMSYKTYTIHMQSYFFFTLIPPLAYFSVHFSFLGSRRSLNMSKICDHHFWQS